MVSSRQADRAKILEMVEYSIQCRMDHDSIEQYVAAARVYGKQYHIEGLVEAWLLEGRKVFGVDEARVWAETLP